MRPHTIPEITPQELAEKLAGEEEFILLDVREPAEIAQVRLADKRLLVAPTSQLAYQGLEALPEQARDPGAQIVVMCHHGVRSADVTVWLRAQGWGQTFSLRGGIDAYALLVDPSIGRYY